MAAKKPAKSSKSSKSAKSSKSKSKSSTSSSKSTKAKSAQKVADSKAAKSSKSTKPAKSTSKVAKSEKSAKSESASKTVKASAKSAAVEKPKKFSWKSLEKQMEKLKALVDEDKHAEALPQFEALMPTLPPFVEHDHERERRQLWNLYGIVLVHVKQFANARRALGEAIALGDDYARLNLIDMMLDEEKDWAAAIAEVGKARESWHDAYNWAWLARYISIAYLETNEVAKAEAELRKIVELLHVDKPDLITSVREGIEKYVEPGTRPNTDAAKGFLDWVKPKSYDTSPEEAAKNRAWWDALPEKIREKFLEALELEEESDLAIARARDVKKLYLDEDDGKFEDFTAFLSCPWLERLSFYGNPESIEPLRALTKLEYLTINNDVIKNFKWPTQAERDLWAAAKNCDKKGIEKALAAGASIMARDDGGDTALHHVAMKHDEELCLWLIAQGADPWAGCHGESSGMYFFGDETREKFAAAAVKAGLRHADDDPYREFSVAYHNKGATFEDPSIEDIIGIDDGHVLSGKWPAIGMTMKMEPPKKDNKLHPVLKCGYRSALVNEAVAEIVRGEGVELLPVTIVDHAGKKRDEKYFYLNPTECDCIDREKAHVQWNHIDPESASEIAAFAIDDAKVGGRQIFRPGLLCGRPMIVTKAMAEKLKSFEGVRIELLKR